MVDEIISGIVTFRYTRDNIEMLVITLGDKSSHPRGSILAKESIEKETLKQFYTNTGLSLLVASTDPIFVKASSNTKKTKERTPDIYYYAGIVDGTQEVLLADELSEYFWIDHLGGRNALHTAEDIEAYENARIWLYDHDEAALFLASNVKKLL